MNEHFRCNVRAWLAPVAVRSADASIAGFVIFCLLGVTSLAHEVRPAYLELREDRPGEFSVLLKTPMLGELRLALTPDFRGQDRGVDADRDPQRRGDAAVQTWRLRALEPLRGQMVGIAGLNGTMTDALVRIELHPTAALGTAADAAATGGDLPQRAERLRSWPACISSSGSSTSCLGVDHLLFVLALLHYRARHVALVKTSHRLHGRAQHHAGAGDARLCSCAAKPVEAVIALSIVFVAAEIVHAHRGRQRPRGKRAVDRGVHVRAAARIRLRGRPERGRPAAGTHPGGAAVLQPRRRGRPAAVRRGRARPDCCIRRSRLPFPRWAELVPPYAIGSVAMFWVFQRVAMF